MKILMEINMCGDGWWIGVDCPRPPRAYAWKKLGQPTRIHHPSRLTTRNEETGA